MIGSLEREVSCRSRMERGRDGKEEREAGYEPRYQFDSKLLRGGSERPGKSLLRSEQVRKKCSIILQTTLQCKDS